MNDFVNKYIYYLFFPLLFAYHILISFQGFEVCDTGWYATFYQNVFISPESVKYNFLYWLTGVIGGGFMLLLPDAGLLVLRILGASNVMLIVLFVYLFVKEYVKPVPFIFGMIVISLLYGRLPLEFSHNNLSVLLFVFASFLLYKGLKRDYFFMASLSGFIVALNVFVRLPNVLDVSLVLVVFLYSLLFKKSYVFVAKHLIFFFFGCFLSLVFSFWLLGLLGHNEYYFDAISSIFYVASGNTENTHTVSGMLFDVFMVYKRLFKIAFVFIVGMFLFFFLMSLKIFRKNIYLSVVLLFLFFVFSLFFTLKFRPVEILYSLTIVVFVLCFFSCTREEKVLGFIGFLMAVVLPLGTESYIYNFNVAALWFALPFSFNLLYMKLCYYYEKYLIKGKAIDSCDKRLYCKYCVLVFLLPVFIKGFFDMLNGAYFDPGLRFEKTYKIDNIRARGIFTNERRAGIINNMLHSISQYVKEGDSLIVYESMPMIHYLTNTRPFLEDSWLIASASNPLSEKLEILKKEKKDLPLVLRQKFQTIGAFGEPDDKYLKSDRGDYPYVSEKQTKMFNEFLDENEYKVLWENKYFVLYNTKNN